MKRLDRLIREARAAAEYRGHILPDFKHGTTKAMAFCTRCSMYVYANARPAPNEIDIGGTAVALNCTRPHRIQA